MTLSHDNCPSRPSNGATETVVTFAGAALAKPSTPGDSESRFYPSLARNLRVAPPRNLPETRSTASAMSWDFTADVSSLRLSATWGVDEADRRRHRVELLHSVKHKETTTLPWVRGDCDASHHTLSAEDQEPLHSTSQHFVTEHACHGGVQNRPWRRPCM